MVEVYLHYYLRYNYMFRLSNNSHLQDVHESLGKQLYKKLIWAVYSVVWVRDLVCVTEAGGVGTWGKCCYVYIHICVCVYIYINKMC